MKCQGTCAEVPKKGKKLSSIKTLAERTKQPDGKAD